MSERTDIDLLSALWEAEDPDPVDVFEDELARRLGFERHPELDYDAWRRRRVEAIEAAGAAADEEAIALEAELLDS